MITLEVNNDEYSNFLSAEVEQSLDEISGFFSFTAATDGEQPFPVNIGDACRVLVDGEPVVTGFIEILEVEYNSDSHTVLVQGRDKTSDLIDSTLGKGVEYSSTITLKRVIENVLTLLNITDIEVIDEVGDIKPFSTAEKVSAETGITAFELLESYCRKRQVLLTSNGDGNIVITRSNGMSSDYKLLNVKLGDSVKNNIKAGRVTYDNTGRFNQYLVKSQLNVSLLNVIGDTSAGDIVNSLGSAIDSDIRSTRIFNMLAEKASSKDQCQARAVWQANVSRARSFGYDATVAGHAFNGEVWQLNRLLSIQDDYAGINGEYLINRLSFSYNVREGSTTKIGVVNKDAYQLIASEPQAQKQVNLLGAV